MCLAPGDSWWEDWPTEPSAASAYREPDEDETAARRYLMASAALIFPLSAGACPPRRPGHAMTVEDRAREAVRVLTRAMNAVVGPVIEILERS